MNIQELESGFSIADAVAPQDLEEIARRGFKAVICNRRPGEAEDHPDDRALSEKAADLGLKWRCIPVTPGEYSDADIEAFGQALDALPTPILAFCRTGKRAVHLWAHARSKDATCDIPALMAAAHAAGHDLEERRGLLEAGAGQN
ncbi:MULTISPECIES: TIGR01244 family sulfur transferase [Halomonas]|uniref:Beta-lactamase hydrolase-like protein n=1 Tax=Halomonas chromatireducens TaxID=507626 RepID=A0A0X8HC09_9GAMM|nr:MULTISPECIES: TIGR01244 family sulfur transferase [Halomonas]AMC99814.1 Beta-lactamase hydrolase-like protein [Halomonas chromatireducens]MBZ0328700.1 TIGR01244 family phosphatase [Halomonas sp. ANAO-440]